MPTVRTLAADGVTVISMIEVDDPVGPMSVDDRVAVIEGILPALSDDDLPQLVTLARQLLDRAEVVAEGVANEDALEAVTPISEALTAATEGET